MSGRSVILTTLLLDKYPRGGLPVLSVHSFATLTLRGRNTLLFLRLTKLQVVKKFKILDEIHVFIIYKVVKYRKMLLIYIVYFIFSLVKI